MAGGKLPPRQKMIGLMYLVLMALLAMNVSKSILDSFLVINDGIESTTTTFDAKNEFIYNALNKAAVESPAAKKYADKANKVKKMSDELYEYIRHIKVKLIEVTDKKPPEVADTIQLKYLDGLDNYDEPTRLMGIAEPATPGESPDCPECSSLALKKKLNEYQKGLLDMFEDKNVRADVEPKIFYLNTPDLTDKTGHTQPWEVGVFYHNPLGAVVTLLSKIQSDIRTAEAEVIGKLYENIDAGGVSFNQVDGFAYAPKGYVLDGDSFHAEIFTAAYDNTQDPDIYVTTAAFDTAAALAVNKTGKFDINKIMKGKEGKKWGDGGDWFKLSSVNGGKGYLDIKEGVGLHEWGGIIKIKTKKGPKVYPFSNSFEVGKPSTTVAATKMNVLYAGVDNPISVAAPVPQEKIIASAPGLRKTAKGWSIKPSKKGEITVVVSANLDGKKQTLGKAKFRVKRIPDPKSAFGGKSGSVNIPRAQLKNSSTIQAKMENFDFDLRVSVKSFKFSTRKGDEIVEVKVNGNKLNGKCKALTGKAKRGQQFFIEEIMVRMPDGSNRKLAPIILKAI